MPSYELEITDPEGGPPATGTYESSAPLGVDDTFEYEGGTLLVTAVEGLAGEGFDAKLVCAPQGGRPHYF